MYQANLRQGTHKTRTRSERSGGGSKPWRQKGTGRARVGSSRSPLWRKGGVIHGPRPRDYSVTMPRKALRRARDSAIFAKLCDAEVVCIESFPTDLPRTKVAAERLAGMGLTGEKILISVAEVDETLLRMVRNIPKVTLLPIADLNAFHLLSHGKWVLTRPALDALIESKKASASGVAGAGGKKTA